jgi:hypothetical protein
LFEVFNGNPSATEEVEQASTSPPRNPLKNFLSPDLYFGDMKGNRTGAGITIYILYLQECHK